MHSMISIKILFNAIECTFASLCIRCDSNRANTKLASKNERETERMDFKHSESVTNNPVH